MDFAVTRNATTSAWRAAQRKKAVVLMAFADRLLTTRILTMTARMGHVTGKTNVKITMVIHVLLRRNVCLIIASTVSAAAIFAWGLAKHAVQRKRVLEAMAYAAILP